MVVMLGMSVPVAAVVLSPMLLRAWKEGVLLTM